MTENALKCKFNGGNPTVGYIIDSDQYFQIDPVKAPFVLDAFKMYDEGSTMSQVRNYLNEHNVTNNRGGKHTINNKGFYLYAQPFYIATGSGSSPDPNIYYRT